MPELRELIDKSRELYPQAFPGCKFREVEKVWNFPSGAKIEFGFLERDADVYRYQGQAYSWIGFDEITHLPTEFGWNYTLFVFCLFLLSGLVAAYFVRSPSETESVEKTSDQSFKEALSEAFKTKSYILLVSGFFVCGFHITLVGTHVPKYVIDRGLEDWTAAAILSLIGLFNIFGSLLSGYLSTKISKKVLLSAIYLLRGVSIIYFIFLPPSVFNSVVFGVTFGFLWLSTVPPTNGIVAHIFGTKYVGCLLYTSPSPRDLSTSRMPSSA